MEASVDSIITKQSFICVHFLRYGLIGLCEVISSAHAQSIEIQQSIPHVDQVKKKKQQPMSYNGQVRPKNGKIHRFAQLLFGNVLMCQAQECCCKSKNLIGKYLGGGRRGEGPICAIFRLGYAYLFLLFAGDFTQDVQSKLDYVREIPTTHPHCMTSYTNSQICITVVLYVN